MRRPLLFVCFAAAMISACGDEGVGVDDAQDLGDASDTSDTSDTNGDPDGLDGDGDGDDTVAPAGCELEEEEAAPDYLQRLGCEADFEALASAPLDTSIPGARSVKVVYDRLGGNALYFQNSVKYQIHHDFAAEHLSGGALPLVQSLSDFNQTEYFSPDRRFILGALTHYEGPDLWALEISPYDTASAEMIGTLFAAVKAASFVGGRLVFHPTSENVAAAAAELGDEVTIATTDDIYAGIDYQPLNLAVAYGRLHFITAAQLATEYVSYRDIVVLDEIPNDITVVSGIITEAFQTPLSHINVLSQNRKTPNMGLRGATTNATLRALDGKWVRLEVGALDWSVAEASLEEADTWWEAHRPAPVTLPTPNFEVTELRDIEDVTPETEDGVAVPLRDALVKAVLAFGGKAAHYSILAKTDGVPMRKAFAIPAYYFKQFFDDNGLYAMLHEMEADPDFQADPAVRDARLEELRAAIEAAPLDQGFQDALRAKMDAEYPGLSMRFRSSTNSEDLDGFPCAGCYESHTGDPAKGWDDVLDAIRETWASAFLFRTYEERSYYGVAHESVVMPLLVHHNFPDEAANGVALTANPYDSSGLQPGFYINVQVGGDNEVVHPNPGTTSDEIVYQYDEPGQPIIYVSHSSDVAEGTTVLTRAQIAELGRALAAIHERFSPAYGPRAGNDGWYAMDIEFKYEAASEGATPTLVVKQGRPNPGRGD